MNPAPTGGHPQSYRPVLDRNPIARSGRFSRSGLTSLMSKWAGRSGAGATGAKGPWQNPYSRTPDRLHPQRMPEPFRDSEREESQADRDFIFRLLPRVEDPFRAGQAMSARTADLECRKDCQDSATRWPASPLSTCCSVTRGRPTYFWRTTGKSSDDTDLTIRPLLCERKKIWQKREGGM